MLKNKFINLLFLFILFISSPAHANSEQFFGIGIKYTQEPFNKKIIITEVLPNTPAEHAGIRAGSQILSVNGEKVKKECLCSIADKIRGEEGTAVTLVTRYGWKREKFEITRGLITVPESYINRELEASWKAVAPSDYQTPEVYPEEITDKFTRKYRKTVLPLIKYWTARKAKFEQGYNVCKTFSREMSEACIMNLISTENITTIEDKKIYKLLRNEVKQ